MGDERINTGRQKMTPGSNSKNFSSHRRSREVEIWVRENVDLDLLLLFAQSYASLSGGNEGNKKFKVNNGG
jgi:hypothetical protein